MALTKVIPIDDHLKQIVRGSVEEALNSLLDAEADQLCNAGRYELRGLSKPGRCRFNENPLQTSVFRFTRRLDRDQSLR